MADKVSKFIFPVKSGTQITNKEFDLPSGGSVTVDDALSDTSKNPVQNKVVKQAVDGKSNTGHNHDDRYYTEAEENQIIDGLQTATTNAQQMIAPILSSLVAPSGGLASGDQFIYQGLLYKATATIAQGGTITINGNCTLADNVTEQIGKINTELLKMFPINDVYSGDLNNLTSPGVYYMYGASNHSLISDGYGLIIVFSMLSVSFQLEIGYASNNILAYRKYYSGAWNSWMTITATQQ